MGGYGVQSCVGREWVPAFAGTRIGRGIIAIPVSSTGEARIFLHQGGRSKMDSRLRGKYGDGCGGREMPPLNRPAVGSCFRRNDEGGCRNDEKKGAGMMEVGELCGNGGRSCVGREWVPAFAGTRIGRGITPIPVSSTGQARIFPYRGGRAKMDSRLRGKYGDGCGGREMPSLNRPAVGSCFRRNDEGGCRNDEKKGAGMTEVGELCGNGGRSCVGREWVPAFAGTRIGRGIIAIPVSSTGQARIFLHQGGRSKMDSRLRGKYGDGCGGREMPPLNRPAVGSCFRRNDEGGCRNDEKKGAGMMEVGELCGNGGRSCVGREWGPAFAGTRIGMGSTPIPVSITGQARIFPYRGERAKMDSRLRGKYGDGCGGREMPPLNRPAVGSCFRRNDEGGCRNDGRGVQE